MKYYQEFKITPELVQLIKKYKVQDTIASNLADGQSYALGLNTLQIINKIEATLIKQVDFLSTQVEESIEDLADSLMGVVDINTIEIQTETECVVFIKANGEKKKLINSSKSRDNLIEEFLPHYPELMWVIKEQSPLFSRDYQDLVVKLQYYNYLIKL